MKTKIFIIAFLALASYSQTYKESPDELNAKLRVNKKIMAGLNFGWNGLAGLGPNLSYYFTPQIALDLSGGLSGMGWKGGFRGRYLINQSKKTIPYIGLGFISASGTLGQEVETPDGYGLFELKSSQFIQYSVGIDYQAYNGFSFLVGIGYAQLLTNDNYKLTAGFLTNDDKDLLETMYGSGIAIEFTAGYAF